MMTFWRSPTDEPARGRQPPHSAIAPREGYVRRVSVPIRTHPRHPASDVSQRSAWVACQQFGSELEASIAVAILDGSGIPAIIRSNDSVGLFGSAFQGFSAMGVTLLVPSSALSAARTVLALARPVDDDGVDGVDDEEAM